MLMYVQPEFVNLHDNFVPWRGCTVPTGPFFLMKINWPELKRTASYQFSLTSTIAIGSLVVGGKPMMHFMVKFIFMALNFSRTTVGSKLEPPPQ